MSEQSDANLNSEERPDHGEYATLAEVIEATHALSETDYKKLILIAGFFWRQRTLKNYALQPEDLLSEAVVRTLTGQRRWRKTQVSVIKHLDRTMESISSPWLERGMKYGEVLENLKTMQQAERAPGSTIEKQLMAREQLAAMAELFRDDPEAWRLLQQKAEGKTAPEIRKALGISTTGYETISKRIRRAFIKYAAQLERT